MRRNRPSPGRTANWNAFDLEDEPLQALRECEWDGCAATGEYRAPKSPQDIHSFRWFCLDHVREYNSSWNFFAELSEDEIEAIIRRDTVWHRPSWPLGARPGSFEGTDRVKFRDPFNLFDGEAEAELNPQRGPRDDALAELGLDRTASAAQIKARYKILVKRHHPDANGGSKESEERIKTINMAYTYLRNNDDS